MCNCDNNINDKFPNFKFMFDNSYFEIKATDYIYYDESNPVDYCQILIKINYESDLFIAGKYIMNNYYIIFDIDNSQLKIYPNKESNITFEQQNVIFFLFALSVGIMIFLSYCFIYKKLCSRALNNENILNEDLIQENEGDGNIP